MLANHSCMLFVKLSAAELNFNVNFLPFYFKLTLNLLNTAIKNIMLSEMNNINSQLDSSEIQETCSRLL